VKKGSIFYFQQPEAKGKKSGETIGMK